MDSVSTDGMTDFKRMKEQMTNYATKHLVCIAYLKFSWLNKNPECVILGGEEVIQIYGLCSVSAKPPKEVYGPECRVFGS